MDRSLLAAAIRLIFNDLSQELATEGRSGGHSEGATAALHAVSWAFMDIDVEGVIMRAECMMVYEGADRDEEVALSRDAGV